MSHPQQDQVLMCRIADHPTALPLGEVREVVAIAEMMSVPDAPPWICGLLNVCGEAIPVADVTARLNRQRRAPTLSDVVVVCTVEGKTIGLLVQEVMRVTHIERQEALALLHELPHARFFVGVFKHGDEVIPIFDIPSLWREVEP